MTELSPSEIKAFLDQGLTLDQIFEREAEQKAMQVIIDAEEARHPMWKKDYNPMLEKENIDNLP